MENETISAEPQNVAVAALLAAIVDELRRLHNSPPGVPRRAYSVEEVAKMFNVTPKSVRGCIDRGELQTVEVGRHLRITAASVERFIKS